MPVNRRKEAEGVIAPRRRRRHHELDRKPAEPLGRGGSHVPREFQLSVEMECQDGEDVLVCCERHRAGDEKAKANAVREQQDVSAREHDRLQSDICPRPRRIDAKPNATRTPRRRFLPPWSRRGT